MLATWAWCALALGDIIVSARWAWLAGQGSRIEGRVGWAWHTPTFTLIEHCVAWTRLTFLGIRIVDEPTLTSLTFISLCIVELASWCITLPTYFVCLIILVSRWAWNALAASCIEVEPNWAFLTSLRSNIEEHFIGAVLALLGGRIVDLLRWASLAKRGSQVQKGKPTAVETGTSS